MEAIKRLREARGLQQADVAIKLGVDRSTISHWENGDCHPRFTMIPKLAMVLGCSVEDLLQDAN